MGVGVKGTKHPRTNRSDIENWKIRCRRLLSCFAFWNLLIKISTKFDQVWYQRDWVKGVGVGGKGTKDPRTYRSDIENWKIRCTTALFVFRFWKFIDFKFLLNLTKFVSAGMGKGGGCMGNHSNAVPLTPQCSSLCSFFSWLTVSNTLEGKKNIPIVCSFLSTASDMLL